MSSLSEEELTINRREAIRRVSAMLGGAVLIGGSALWTGCGTDRGAAYKGVGTFTPPDVALLDEVADTILPTTKTPGAKAAMVGPFIALMVTDCYDEKDQKIFRDGMKQLDDASRKASNATFMKATPEARLALLETLDREQKAYMDAKKDEDPNHYFRMMKELTLLGYFTSEIGYTKAMRYVESPGRFDPCVPYTPGEVSWASHA
ncbi:MAG: gluconate 2-dehydrogenase subunit 3 family protein [Gemmatimonadaceae bacterium]